MQVKDIKLTVKKQLKTKSPGWKRLSKSRKRALASQVLEEVMSGYDFSGAVDAPLHELTGVPELPAGVLSLSEMEEFFGEAVNKPERTAEYGQGRHTIRKPLKKPRAALVKKSKSKHYRHGSLAPYRGAT